MWARLCGNTYTISRSSAAMPAANARCASAVKWQPSALMYGGVRVEQGAFRTEKRGDFRCARCRLRDCVVREFGIAFYAVAQHRRGEYGLRGGRKRAHRRKQRAEITRHVAGLSAVRFFQVIRAERIANRHHDPCCPKPASRMVPPLVRRWQCNDAAGGR